MEVKKSQKADLEKKKGIFLQLGLVVVLALVYMAFEWTTGENLENTLGNLVQDEAFEEEIVNTFRENLPPPPPPPPAAPEVLEIHEDDEVIEEDLFIPDTETDEDTKINIVVVEEEEEVEEVFNFYVLEDQPEFPGGNDAITSWIAKNTTYPEIAKDNGITGKVFVQFVIGKDGSVTNVQVMRAVDPYLDKEAVRVVQSMPKWKPGKQRGKPVKVSFQVPINFKLY